MLLFKICQKLYILQLFDFCWKLLGKNIKLYDKLQQNIL